MDLRTGQTYRTVEDARAAGVPDSDIVRVDETSNGPEVKTITSGPFKGRTYRRNHLGQMVRVVTPGKR